MYKQMHILYRIQGLGWWEEEFLRFEEEVNPHDLVLAATTIGDEGTPSELDMGPARHRNPAESGQHGYLAILDLELLN